MVCLCQELFGEKHVINDHHGAGVVLGEQETLV